MNENFLQAILQSIAWLLTRLLSVLTPLFIGLAIAYLRIRRSIGLHKNYGAAVLRFS